MRRWPVISLTVLLCGALTAGCTSQPKKTAAKPGVTDGPTAGPSAGPASNLTAPAAKLVHTAVATALVSPVHVVMRSTLHGDGEPATVTVTGDHDMHEHVGRLTVTLSDGPVRTVHEILTPQDVYVTTKDATAGPWSRTFRPNILLQHLLRPPANDPEYPVVQAKLITNVVKKGTGTINGFKNATHYTGVVPSVTMLQDAASAQRDHLADILSAMPHSETPMDVWIDQHGRVIRVTETISAPSKGFSGTLTVDLTGYGVKVDATAPKKSTPLGANALPSTVLG